MFTGIVEQTGRVLKIYKSDVLKLIIQRPVAFDDLKTGDSLSVDGVCLTIEHLTDKEIGFFVSKETLKTTKSYILKKHVNLERSVKYGDRLHGHLMTGHVHGAGTITKAKIDGQTLDLVIKLPKNIGKIDNKSSISINGVSLTVNAIKENYIHLHIIPETFNKTNLKYLKKDDLVNIEPDSLILSNIQKKSTRRTKALNTIPELIEDIQNKKMVILVDDEDRENEGDLVIASDFITPDKVNFMVKNARGLVCAAITLEQASKLKLPLMVDESSNFSHNNTAFTISVEASKNVTTGISAADRATTIKAVCNPKSMPSDIVSPGHIFPIVAKKGGVLKRAGHTEGSIDLVKLAGFNPSAVVCEIMKDNGQMARMKDLKNFALIHDIKIGSIADLIRHRIKNESLVYKAADCTLPIEGCGTFELKVFKTSIDDAEHLVLQKGKICKNKPTLVRVHSQCMTGDVFASQRCDCGKQLQCALEQINKNGQGVILYLRQEGRGIGLVNKIKSYTLQDQGMDTFEANMHLGFRPDERDYGIGAQILRAIGVKKINLMTNNPSKKAGLDGYGLEISNIIPIEITANKHNIKYLHSKKEKMGHLLKMLDN